MGDRATRTGSPWRRRFAAVADIACLLLTAAGALIELHGPFAWRVGRDFVTARSSTRPFLLAAAVLVVRHSVVFSPSILSRIRSTGRQVAAAIRPHARIIDLGVMAFGAVALVIDLAGGVRWHWGPQPYEWTTGATPGLIAAIFLGIRLAVSGGDRVPGIWTGAVYRAPAPDVTWPSRREWISVALFMTLATAVMWRQQIAAFTSVPHYGDPLFSMWRLAWFAHQIRIDPWNLYNANIFYPDERTLAYSDSMLAPAVIAAPALWLGAPVTAVYTSLVLLTFIACGVAMYALVRALTRSTPAAIVAGLIFAFDPFRIDHYGHLELLFSFWMPLALLAILRTLSAGRLRDGILTGIFVTLLALSSLYYAAFFAVGTAALVVGWIWTRGWLTRKAVAALAVAGLIAAFTAALVTIPYRANRLIIGQRGISEIEVFSGYGRDYLSAPALSSFYRGTRFDDSAEGEHALFTGLLPPALALISLATPAGTVVAPAAIALAVSVDSSLGVHGTSYSWLNNLTAFRGFRVPARFRAIVGVFMAILAGFGFVRLLRLLRRTSLQLAVTVTACAALMIEMQPALRPIPVWKAPPPIYDAIPAGAVIADLPIPYGSEPFWHDFVYMYYSTFHWHPMINGSSGFIPGRYLQVERTARMFPTDRGIEGLRKLGVEYVVMHEQFYEGYYRAIIAAADAESALELIKTVTWQEGEVRLYRLKR